jgi:hypothetical protein
LAETVNDENVVIIHDANIANLYYQEFVKRFQTNGGAYGIDETQNTPILTFYPNPASEKIRCVVNFTNYHTLLNIYDVVGMKIFETAITQPQFELSVNKFSRGIYFLEVLTSSSSEKQKLIIH